MRGRNDKLIHAVLISLVIMTLLPFVYVVINSLRTNPEQYRASIAVPDALKELVNFPIYAAKGQSEKIILKEYAEADEKNLRIADRMTTRVATLQEGMSESWKTLSSGYRIAWKTLRGYTLNTLLVCAGTIAGVLLLGSISGYVFSRYRFPGRGILFMVLLSIIMIPPVLTLIPSFLLVKKLGMLNSMWALLLPYIAGGQIVAIFLFKSFFDGLPEELFESARLEGAGHFALYWYIVLPLSKQIAAVVAVMNVLGVWNNFLWPFTVNTDTKYHVVSSGIYLMTQGMMGQNFAAMNAAFVLSAIPLLVLFVYATKPFMQGMTSGAFKA